MTNSMQRAHGRLAGLLLLVALAPSLPAAAQTHAARAARAATPAASTQAASKPAEAPNTAILQAGSATAPQPAAVPTDSSSASAAATTTATRGGAHAAPALTLEQRIAQLPALPKVNLDVKAQSQGILAHLSEVLRFYRTATTKIQKAGEPSDVLYAEQVKAQATQIAQLAFESAHNEAALLTRIDPAATNPAGGGGSSGEGQRLAAAKARVTAQITALQQVDAANDAAIAKSTAATRGPLLQRQEQIDGEFKLLQATLDALNRVGNITQTESGRSGLPGDVDRLASTAPELTAGTGKSITAPALENVADAQHAGLVTQASVLFDLLSSRRSIDEQIAETDKLRQQADQIRTPFTNVLRSTIKEGEALEQASVQQRATPGSNQQDILATRRQFDQLTATFSVLSDAMLPLSQEVMVLEAERGTLTSWRVAVEAEYKTIFRSLLVRLGFIAGALLLLTVLSTAWNRATIKYVSDLRRRRQLLVIRRVAIGFLGGLIVIFGFVTQFSSLATFAGFITAGIAVGLQSILLSVAAYFFIIGRYGVRVGDRITVAGVTGTVIEVGLARFYLMELVGSGNVLHSTGRVAVLANSVLFQTGTPLYKQLPGTEYAWHDLTAKLKPEADVDAVTRQLCDIVTHVYAGYKEAIDAQQREIEGWMGAAIDPPSIDSHLRMGDDGLQVAILFPVEIEGAGQADAAIAAAVVAEMAHDGPLKAGLAGFPVIKAAIKS